MRIGKEFYPLKLLLTDYIDINTHFIYLERYDGCLRCACVVFSHLKRLQKHRLLIMTAHDMF